MSSRNLASPSKPASPSSPASPILTAQFVLDESAVKEVAREASQTFNGKAAPWAGNHTDCDVGAGGISMPVPRDGIIRVGVQLRLPRSPSLPPAGQQPAATATLKRVRRLGTYSVPIEWQLDGSASVMLGPQNQSANVGISGRVRLSAWTAPNNNWVLDDKGTKRFARKRWKALDNRWGLDDITFTQTVRLMDPEQPPPKGAPAINGKPDPDAVWWANNFLPSLKQSDKELTDWMRDAIRFFHTYDIQVFAGYEIVTEDWTLKKLPRLPEHPTDKQNKQFELDMAAYKSEVADKKRNRRFGDAFVRWLQAKDNTISAFAEHARKLVAFFDERELDIDGISYDLEIDASNKGDGLGRRHGNAIQALYLAVMQQLSVKERYLALAAPGIANATIMLEQPYTLGRLLNILVRTMSYDVARESVVVDSLTRVGLHPSHLQIGFTTRKEQPGDIDVPAATNEARIIQSYRVGFIHWYLLDHDLQQYKTYDRALNETAPRRGTRGQPLQGPLGPQRLEAFAAARAAEEKEMAPLPPK